MALSDILNQPFPKVTHLKDTFFDVINQNSRETAISRAYAYFMDRNKNPHLAECFLESLKELIWRKKEMKLFLINAACQLEVQTKVGNRIDLLITSDHSKEAVIIENKIYHKLDNALQDYWEHSTCAPNKKIGILLTLGVEPIPLEFRQCFINITHGEWIREVDSRIEADKVPEYKRIYIQDFINNINKLTDGNHFNESVQFFFNNTTVVPQAVEVDRVAKKYVLEQLRQVANSLEGKWSLSSGNSNYQQIWDHTMAYYTVITDKLYEGKNSIMIVLELFGKAKDKNIVLELWDEFAEDEHFKELNKGEIKTHYAHFAYKIYPVNNEILSKLGYFITGYIEKDFVPLMDALRINLRKRFPDFDKM